MNICLRFSGLNSSIWIWACQALLAAQGVVAVLHTVLNTSITLCINRLLSPKIHTIACDYLIFAHNFHLSCHRWPFIHSYIKRLHLKSLLVRSCCVLSLWKKPKVCKWHELSTMKPAAGVAPLISPLFELRCLCALRLCNFTLRTVAFLQMDSLLIRNMFVWFKS